MFFITIYIHDQNAKQLSRLTINGDMIISKYDNRTLKNCLGAQNQHFNLI